MTTNLLVKKKLLRPGEKIRLCYDECFKMMFANTEHLEPLTLLLSKILNVDYDIIDGKIALLPLTIPGETVGEKKMERDILVKIFNNTYGKVILEVNFREEFYETVINRNINYLSEVASKGLKQSDSYDMIVPTLLVNFNTFYVDKKHKKSLDEYYYRNKEGYILTKNQKILNINIVSCYKEWYNGTYKTLNDDYERDLVLLSALIYTDKEEEFEQITLELTSKRKIRKVIKEVSTRMTEDEVLTVRYVDFLEENKKINQSIINDERRKAKLAGFEKGQRIGEKIGEEKKEREMILSMYYKNIDINVISDISKLSLSEVKQIIDEKSKKL